MARLPRLYAPDTPQLAQVGFARPLALPSQPTPSGRLNVLADWVKEAALNEKVAVHGWVLLNDRLILLATPPGPAHLSKVIQAVGRRYATRIQHGRVFDGRYRSALLQPGVWVLPALVWLENLPVRLHYVDQAEQWPWSSARLHTGHVATRNHAPWETSHRDYWAEGNTPFDRQAKYRQRLQIGLPPRQIMLIERAVFGQWALGDDAFLQRMQMLSSRRVSPGSPGRPRKEAPASTPAAAPSDEA